MFFLVIISCAFSPLPTRQRGERQQFLLVSPSGHHLVHQVDGVVCCQGEYGDTVVRVLGLDRLLELLDLRRLNPRWAHRKRR